MAEKSSERSFQSASATIPAEEAEKVISEAQEASTGGIWKEASVAIPLGYEGDTGSSLAEAASSPTIGGAGRVDKAIAILGSALSRVQIDALVDVVIHEIMVRNAIPGKDLKVGIASMIAITDLETRKWTENRITTSRQSVGKDEYVRQQHNILENKFEELEQLVARRSQEEIRIVEKATDILARIELKEASDMAVGEDLLSLQRERAELTEDLQKLKETAPAVKELSAQRAGKRSGRRTGLF